MTKTYRIAVSLIEFEHGSTINDAGREISCMTVDLGDADKDAAEWLNQTVRRTAHSIGDLSQHFNRRGTSLSV